MLSTAGRRPCGVPGQSEGGRGAGMPWGRLWGSMCSPSRRRHCGVESAPSWSAGFPAAPPQSLAGVTGQCRRCLRDNPWPDNPAGGEGTWLRPCCSSPEWEQMHVRCQRAGASGALVPTRSAALRLGRGKRRCRCPWGCGGAAAACGGLAPGPGMVGWHQPVETGQGGGSDHVHGIFGCHRSTGTPGAGCCPPPASRRGALGGVRWLRQCWEPRLRRRVRLGVPHPAGLCKVPARGEAWLSPRPL